MTLQNQNIFLSTVGWKENRDKNFEWQNGLWFEGIMRWIMAWRKINETMTKQRWCWLMMSWWNLKLIAEQRDDQNPNLQSIFSVGHQWCWSSKAICLTIYLTWQIFAREKWRHEVAKILHGFGLVLFWNIVFMCKGSQPRIYADLLRFQCRARKI